MINTVLLLIILVVLVLLVLAVQKILAQNKTILQNERDIANIQTAMTQQKADFDVELTQKIKDAQKRSNNMQRNVLKGQIGEQFTPFIADFPYNPSDCRFLGEPIDYMIFQNLHACSEGLANIEDVQIVIAEVKTGSARLNTRQKIIKQAIENGQVSFKELRIKHCENTENMIVLTS